MYKRQLLALVATELVVKKRRPINKKEARFIKEGILNSHNLDMPIEAGKYEIGKTEDFNILISKGNVIALIGDSPAHHLGLSSRIPGFKSRREHQLFHIFIFSTISYMGTEMLTNMGFQNLQKSMAIAMFGGVVVKVINKIQRVCDH